MRKRIVKSPDLDKATPSIGTKLYAYLLLSLCAAAPLSGCDRPDPDYPLNTDNTRVVETPGLAPASLSTEPLVTESLVFSQLGFEKTGYFIDSAVSGLQYSSISRQGITSRSGSFEYIEGELIKFYIGNIEIGEVTAKTVITPMDFSVNKFAIDKDNIKLTNILRLFQTLDSDGDASNGITIDENVRLGARDLALSTSINDDGFTENHEVLMFISSVSNTSHFITTEQALNHFEETLAELELTGSPTF